MGTIFYFVLNMSIAATIIGVILIILRGFKVPSNIMYGLWSIVFIRLVFPFALPSTLSALNLLRPIIKKVVEVPTMGQFRFMSFSNYISPQRSYFPFVFSKACQEKLFNTFAYVWICGVCLLLLILFIMLFITNRELSKAYKLRDNIFVSKFVDTPVVFGIIKPKILIPTGIDSNFYGLEYIIQHENVHIKRSDNLWRMLGLMVASIHWFNPFVWFALRLFIADMEFSCDRRVVKRFNVEEKKKYAQVLLNMSSNGQFVMSSAFNRTNIKSRVIRIFKYKNISLLTLLIIFALYLIVNVAFLTNPFM